MTQTEKMADNDLLNVNSIIVEELIQVERTDAKSEQEKKEGKVFKDNFYYRKKKQESCCYKYCCCCAKKSDINRKKSDINRDDSCFDAIFWYWYFSNNSNTESHSSLDNYCNCKLCDNLEICCRGFFTCIENLDCECDNCECDDD